MRIDALADSTIPVAAMSFHESTTTPVAFGRLITELGILLLMPRPAELPYPASPAYADGTRLVHIGPHKTGTTTVQAALFAQREAISRQGVHYAGKSRHDMGAVLAATGRPAPNSRNKEAPPRAKWRTLLREIRSAREPRVVLSSEFLADARPDAIERIVDDLDPSRVQIAVTLRPLAKILPSQWQQYVQAGMRMGIQRWAEGIFSEESRGVSPSFWYRHRHDRLIERWAEVVGAENVTAIVVDDRDHEGILRTFEELLGLEDGMLVADRDLSNRSMSFPEIEVVRAFNQQYAKTELGRAVHAKAMRFGAALYMKQREPRPNETRVSAPQWALDRAGAVAEEMVAHIDASGVRVVGDLGLLTEVPRGWADKRPPVRITPEIAGRAAMGVLDAMLTDAGTGPKAPNTQRALLDAIPARELVQSLLARATAKLPGARRAGETR